MKYNFCIKMLITNTARVEYTVMFIDNRYYYHNNVWYAVARACLITKTHLFDIFRIHTYKYLINTKNMFEMTGIGSCISNRRNYAYVQQRIETASVRKGMQVIHKNGFAHVV